MTNDEFKILEICRTVENYFDLLPGSLHLKTRKREVVQARQIAMYFAKQMTKSSLASIGSQIGYKDHATVLFAIRTVNNLRQTDKEYRDNFEKLEKKLSITYISEEERKNAIIEGLIFCFALELKKKKEFQEIFTKFILETKSYENKKINTV
ncbi:MAG: helix-turn-helix domain-containing protein [Candidatus Paceibacterota bacterium]|jgi:hypothetical protein